MADIAGSPVRLGELIARALAAHDTLADLGETVDDEWIYVNDLRAAWADRLAAVAARRADELADPAAVDAVAAASEEAALVTDPQRAIDWLSTFPQVVLLAFREDP